jgi:hypothetical protein
MLESFEWALSYALSDVLRVRQERWNANICDQTMNDRSSPLADDYLPCYLQPDSASFT